MQKILSLTSLLISLQLAAQQPATIRLFEAIRSGKTAALEQQLSTGADANDSLNGYSALMAATLDGSSDQMSLLILHGANVNYENPLHITALWLAVPDKEKTMILLDHGADASHPVEGYSVLTKCASIPGSVDLIRTLITKGADPRKSAPDNSLLYEAAGSGDTAILGLVIRLGFKVNDTTSSGDYPINSNPEDARRQRSRCERPIHISEDIAGNGWIHSLDDSRFKCRQRLPPLPSSTRC